MKGKLLDALAYAIILPIRVFGIIVTGVFIIPLVGIVLLAFSSVQWAFERVGNKGRYEINRL